MSTERSVIRGLIRHLKAAGFLCAYVNDGEELVRTETEAAALEAAFSVDESTLCFVLASDERPMDERRRYGLAVILGNAKDGSEVCADWHDVEPFTGHVDSYLRAQGFYG